MTTVGGLVKRLKKFPSGQQVQVTVHYPCGCGETRRETAGKIKVGKYNWMSDAEKYPDDYWVQLKAELEGR